MQLHLVCGVRDESRSIVPLMSLGEVGVTQLYQIVTAKANPFSPSGVMSVQRRYFHWNQSTVQCTPTTSKSKTKIGRL